jgi:hypothetical protein
MSLPRISSRQNRDLSYLVVLDVSKQQGFTSPCYLVAQDCIDMKNPYKSTEQEQNEQQELPQTTVRHLGWSPGRRTYGEVSRHDRNGEIRRFCGVSPNALLLRFCEMQSFSIITHTHKHSCCTFSLIFERCGWVGWGYARPWLPVQKSAGKVPEQASMTKCAHPKISLTDRISTSHQHRFGTIICAGTKPGIMPSRLCPPLTFMEDCLRIGGIQPSLLPLPSFSSLAFMEDWLQICGRQPLLPPFPSLVSIVAASKLVQG